MKRYRFTQRGRVYHDTHYSTERCNLDDQGNHFFSDEPPEGKRLCLWCAAQRKRESND